jgi:quercetin dioxygenase-like cupin family protein
MGALAATTALLLTACSGGSEESAASGAASASASAGTSAEGTEVLLDAQQLTTLDQQVTYPKKKPAQVSSVIQTLEPGQETGWHRHKVPQFVYVLEGTVTVEYDAGVVKEYPAGTAYLEAEDIWHNGTNKGDDAVRMLTVYMGAEGAKNSVERTP